MWRPQCPAMLLCVALVTMLALSGVATAKNPHDTNPNVFFGFKEFPGGASKALGMGRIERIRRSNGLEDKTADQLARLLEDDEDLGLDLTSDRLIYACGGMEVTPEVAAAAAAAEAEVAAAEAQAAAVVEAQQVADVPQEAAAAAAAATYALDGGHHHHHHHHRRLQQAGVENANIWLPEYSDTTITFEQAFTLHSRPGATKKIHLDFDGHTNVGSSWNSAYGGGNPIVTPPFDTDGNYTNWTPSELGVILAVWRGVAEDFAPFDVDVTTEEPTGPLSTWVRAAIGGSNADWYKSSAGGVAYVNVWGRSDHYYQPAYVFVKNLGPDHARYIWEATSHEVGHNMGLSHDGTLINGTTTGYYTGHSGWAPIMGVGYYQPLTQWSKGEYPNANQFQDDFSILSSKLSYVSQLHGSSRATATAMGGAPDAGGLTATAKVTGIVRTPDDVEAMWFQATNAGTATLQVIPLPAWSSKGRSNLNLTLTVTDESNTVLATKVGVGIAAFNLPLTSAGVYYLYIQGTGMGNLTTGYSSYGSRGTYQMVAKYPSVVVVPSPSPEPESPSPQPQESPSPSPDVASPSPSPQPEVSPEPSPSPELPSPSPVVPSPSPVVPSPSPVVPSPSPVVPSPSPVVPSPSPSPSPPPVNNIKYMKFSSFTGSRTISGTKVTCKFTLKLVDSSTNAAISAASVAGTWSSTKTASGWPYNISRVSTTTSGGATITSSKTLPTTAGNGCTFTVTSVTKAGYTLDPLSIKSETLGPW